MNKERLKQVLEELRREYGEEWNGHKDQVFSSLKLA